jgi:hypothetical protein
LRCENGRENFLLIRGASDERKAKANPHRSSGEMRAES